jgi:hypothetical protein
MEDASVLGHVFLACAMAAHEANRAYCLAIGDASQVHWEQAPEWQRASALAGVRGVLIDGNGPRESHESWLAEKRADGWKYGPVKDPEAKVHPCFVPYDELPEAQKGKDAIFVTIVRAVAAPLGVISGATRDDARVSWLERDPSQLENVLGRVNNEAVTVRQAVDWLMEQR